MMAEAFNYILVLILVILAWQMLRVKDLFTGIVLYMVFGILMSLAWIQLRAPDIALVEAAIGSGVIGALFLGVIGQLESKPKNIQCQKKTSIPREKKLEVLITGLCFVLGAILTGGILALAKHSVGLKKLVEKNLPQSGVDNPVTAVILNFRAYDTLLEVGVLMLAVLACAALMGSNQTKRTSIPSASRVLNLFISIVVPFMVLIGGYFLWAGSDKPGGAFQAGAILSGAGILVLLSGIRINLNVRRFLFRFLLGAGFLSFLITGIIIMADARNFLEYPPNLAKFLILFIEIMASISISLTFIYLFAVCSGLSLNTHSPVKLKEEGRS